MDLTNASESREEREKQAREEREKQARAAVIAASAARTARLRKEHDEREKQELAASKKLQNPVLDERLHKKQELAESEKLAEREKRAEREAREEQEREKRAELEMRLRALQAITDRERAARAAREEQARAAREEQARATQARKAFVESLYEKFQHKLSLIEKAITAARASGDRDAVRILRKARDLCNAQFNLHLLQSIVLKRGNTMKGYPTAHVFSTDFDTWVAISNTSRRPDRLEHIRLVLDEIRRHTDDSGPDLCLQHDTMSTICVVTAQAIAQYKRTGVLRDIFAVIVTRL